MVSAFGQRIQARKGGAAKHVKHIKEEWGEKANGGQVFQSNCELVKTGNLLLPPVVVYMESFYIRQEPVFPLSYHPDDASTLLSI